MKTFLLDETITNPLISSSLKVKMFIHSQPEEAEKAITHWLKQNDVTIRHITQSQSEKGGSFVFVLTIFFHENQ